MYNGEIYQALAEVCKIRLGQTFKSGLKETDILGEVSVLLPRDLEDGKINTVPVKLQKHNIPALETHLLRVGDILMANKGTKFGTYLYDGKPEVAVATSSFFVITPSKDLIPQYLYWYLNQPPAKSYFTSHAFGSTIPSINKSTLSAFTIPIVKMELQQWIASFIKEAEHEQELLRKLLDKRSAFVNNYIWEQIKNSK